MDLYRITCAVDRGTEHFSVVVAEGRSPERQLPVRFSSRADAEATIAYLKRSAEQNATKRSIEPFGASRN